MTLLACPVCGAAQNEAARQAIVEMTLFLSATALFLLGAIALLAVRHYRAVVERDAELHDFEGREREPSP